MTGGDQFLGLDIGGTKCAAIIGTADGTILARTAWPSRSERGPQPMLRELIAHAQKLRCRQPSVRCAGVSIGGPLDAEAGVINSPPNLPGWDAFPLKQNLAHALQLPVFVEHDAAACALAEYRWGAGRHCERVVYLTCGTGFGMGFVVNGRPYYGAQGRNCEIGHVRYRPDGPVAFGKRGSAEAFCAGESLGRLAAWRFPERWAKQAPRASELATLAARGDRAAREIIAINARAVGDIGAWLADALFPDVILLGSLSRYLGAGWVRQVRAQFVREALPARGTACRIRAAGLGERLQDCSALVVAVEGWRRHCETNSGRV